MGRVFVQFINDDADRKEPKKEQKNPHATFDYSKGPLVIYSCKYCKTHLSENRELISKVSPQFLLAQPNLVYLA
jgi:hypothetical protein